MSSGMGNGGGWAGAKGRVRRAPSLKISLGEFPGGPGGRTLHAHSRGSWFSPWLEN